MPRLLASRSRATIHLQLRWEEVGRMTLMDQVIVSEHLGRVPEEHVESWMVVTLKDCYDHPFLRPWPAVSIKQRMMAVL